MMVRGGTLETRIWIRKKQNKTKQNKQTNKQKQQIVIYIYDNISLSARADSQ